MTGDLTVEGNLGKHWIAHRVLRPQATHQSRAQQRPLELNPVCSIVPSRWHIPSADCTMAATVTKASGVVCALRTSVARPVAPGVVAAPLKASHVAALVPQRAMAARRARSTVAVQASANGTGLPIDLRGEARECLQGQCSACTGRSDC